jgi:hypothetical protein
MNATLRIGLWLSGALASAIPIYIVVAPAPADLARLFSANGYESAAKQVFLFYFSMTIVALFNLLESLIVPRSGRGWRLLIGLFSLAVLLQILISALYYRDLYFGLSAVPAGFAFKILMWAITQSFIARLVFLVPEEVVRNV